MTAKEIVQAKYPTAKAYWDDEWSGPGLKSMWKIYYYDGCHIAISGRKLSIEEAWEDAAQALRAREEVKP